MRKATCVSLLAAAMFILPSNQVFAQPRRVNNLNCEDPYSLCTERKHNQSYDPEYNGRYIGHDEPSLLFYSDVPGSGNYNQYTIALPRDPAVYPTDANRKGTGQPTVWNFQLHPAFWLGMAMCDTESFPEFSHDCKPDSDDNIFDSGDPTSKHYIGRHPGTAFMEMQFYPPGWVTSYDQTRYAAAINIDSLSVSGTGPDGSILNNADCQNTAGLEPVNFALITLDGTSQAPGDPLNADPNKQVVIPGKTMLMNPGDTLIVTMKDTADGFRVSIHDTTTGQTGRMTASLANGFAQVIFDPSASTCTSRPHAFHPMYSTSGPHTRVPWAVHTYNVAFSDEIGHYEYCDVQDDSIIPGLGACLKSPVEDVIKGANHETDDTFCVDTASSLEFGSLGALGGCLDSDVDFDGVPYHHAWAGSGSDRWGFGAVPDPIRFGSPLFHASSDDDGSRLRNYDRLAFEADLPAIETKCNLATGEKCTNPPAGAEFYPLYTTTKRNGQCWWQFGGAAIPGTDRAFGGSSATEFADLEPTVYQSGTTSNPGSEISFENFYRLLKNNPCE